MLKQREQAEALVRERLQAAPDAKDAANMWCLLGDLTGEVEHYDKAWALSDGACARAKLALGAAAMKAGRWEQARAELREAVQLKPQLVEAWYCRGVCAIKLEEEPAALGDFRRVVAADPSHYQAWACLGQLFARSKMKREALFAYREASRLRPDEHQLALNAARAAADAGAHEEAAYRCMRLAEQRALCDEDTCALLAQAAVKLKKAPDASSFSRLLPKVRALLALYCELEKERVAHWDVALYLERACGSKADALRCLDGRLTALCATRLWRTDAAKLSEVSEAAAQMVEARLGGGAPSHEEMVKSAQTVSQLLHEASEHLAASSGCEELRMLQTRLQRHIDDEI